MKRIQTIIEKHFGVDIWMPSRKAEVTYPRQLCHYFARKLYPAKSLQKIGDFYGGKNHATVLHSIKAINDYIDTDRVKAQEIARLWQSIAHNKSWRCRQNVKMLKAIYKAGLIEHYDKIIGIWKVK